MPQRSLHSPIGDLTVSEEDGMIVSVDWGWGAQQSDTPLLAEAVRQLHAYFDGDLTAFDLPLAPPGTTHQKTVWRAMYAIPYGHTWTYGDLATASGSVARAVGAACGANPIPVIIPCHRVLAAGGPKGHLKLGGYSGDGGIETKAALLRLEGALL